MTYITRPFFLLVETFWPVLPLVVAVDLLAVYLLVFRETLDPRSFAFWMVLCIVFPFAGFALYLVFGCTLYAGKAFGGKERADRGSGLADIAGDAPFRCGGDARFYGCLEEALEDISADLASARSVHVELHSMDGAGDVSALLCSKASEGADVRALAGRRVPGRGRLRSSGAEVASFYRRPLSMTAVPLRYKNRRTLICVDGSVAYAGDTALVRIEGPAAADLESRFLADWAFATGRPRESLAPAPETGGCSARPVSTGPDAGAHSALLAYEGLMKVARRTLHLSLPYLAPDENVHAILKLASLSGTEVKVVVPRKGARVYQRWNSFAAAAPLMSSGVRVFMSEKRISDSVIVVDGRICGVGMPPFDGRAMRDRFQTAVMIESERVSGQAVRRLEEAMSSGAELSTEDYAGRSFPDRVRIALSRVMMLFNRGSHVSRFRIHDLGRLPRRRRHSPGPAGRGHNHLPDVHGALRPQVLLRLDDGLFLRTAGRNHTLSLHGPHDILAHLPVQRSGLLEVHPRRGARGP
ncbi:MAG: PLDc N-terminal domain-containing protein [Candidatus Methanomethylophilaceae archaeon]|nr:PLDc N-terminal domain-containing protein [Candidatus Methanomethylophilaceae archaeon]